MDRYTLALVFTDGKERTIMTATLEEIDRWTQQYNGILEFMAELYRISLLEGSKLRIDRKVDSIIIKYRAKNLIWHTQLLFNIPGERQFKRDNDLYIEIAETLKRYCRWAQFRHLFLREYLRIKDKKAPIKEYAEDIEQSALRNEEVSTPVNRFLRALTKGRSENAVYRIYRDFFLAIRQFHRNNKLIDKDSKPYPLFDPANPKRYSGKARQLSLI